MNAMKTTKKIIGIGLCAAMLAGSALAEGATGTGTVPSGTEQQQIQEQNWQGQLPQMPGMNGQNQQGQPPEMPSGNQNGGQQNSQQPQMPGMNGQNQQGQPPEMPSGNQNGGQQNSQQPQMPGMNGQNQQGQATEVPGSDGENDHTAVVQTGNNGKLKMRQGPSQGSKIDSYLKNGTEVEVLEVQDEWVKIRVNDKEGYVMIEFLEGNLQTQEETGQSNPEGGQPPEMPEMNGQNQQGQPPEMPSNDQNGGQQNSQMPQIPGMNGENQQGQPPEMPSNDQNGGQQNSQMPQMPGTNGENQQGQPPAMPSGEQNGNQQNGQPQEMSGLNGENQQGQPPQMPGGQMGGMPGGQPGDMSAPTDYSAAATVTESSDGTDYASTSDSENAVLVSGSEVTISNATVTKTGSSNGESADFYGINASVLAKDGATLTVEGTTITSDGAHANGVFSYGQGTTVNVSDTSITTTGNNSGGLMTTGGALLNATNVTVSTSGNSSAAIRSDRGGGTVHVDGGSYASSGIGSPAIYSTADISVSNATLTSATSEAVVIEGGNTVNLTDVSISGSNSTLNGQSTVKTNVLIYQSMSGDAAEGESAFTMTGGSMVSETGSMFHVTNTTTTINLDHVDFTYAGDSNIFLDASADSWGRSGSNGGNVTLNLSNQHISGAILSDSVSSVSVNLDSNSSWTLQGDSYISGFTGDLANVELNGYTLYVNGTAVTK